MVEAGLEIDQVVEESRALEVETQPALESMLDWFLDEIAGRV